MARKLGLALLTCLTQPYNGHGTHEDESIIAVRDPEIDAVR